MTGFYLNPGNLELENYLNDEFFVDKSDLIRITNKFIRTSNRFFCITRPRRFGKTLAAEMLSGYYSTGCDSSALFDALKISSAPDYEKHLNKHNVIKIDVLGVCNALSSRRMRYATEHDGPNPCSISPVVFLQQEVERELKMQFEGYTEWDLSLPRELSNISRNHPEHPRFIVIIDEWDYLFRKEPANSALHEEYVTLLSELFKSGQGCVELAYMTGIFPIKKYGLESVLNNFREYSMIRPLIFEEYTGFTEQEVAELCKKADMDMDEFKIWYDGYCFNGKLSIYNPMSVVSALNNRRTGSYWTTTESYESLGTYIGLDLFGLKETVAKMAAGEEVQVYTSRFSNNIGEIRTKDDVLTLLIHLGYLSCAENPDVTSLVRIPNREVLSEFVTNFNSDNWVPVKEAIDLSESLLKATWAMKADTVADLVGAAHQRLTSVFDYNDEQALGCVITIAYYTARNYYAIAKEESAGRGRADLIFTPYRTSSVIPMVIELKWSRSAKDKDGKAQAKKSSASEDNCTPEAAIAQIKEKQYYTKFSEYKEVLLVGISYDEQTNRHSCAIERMKI